ncbi:hypothetical protein ACOMHN_040533 [Nucella lapillus]
MARSSSLACRRGREGLHTSYTDSSELIHSLRFVVHAVPGPHNHRKTPGQGLPDPEPVLSAAMTVSGKGKEPETEGHPDQLFQDLYQRAVASGLTPAHIASLQALRDLRGARKTPAWLSTVLSVLKYLLLVLVLLFTAWHLDWPVERKKLVRAWFRMSGVTPEDVDLEKCVFRASQSLADVFRPPVDCDFCKNVSEAIRLNDVRPEDFEALYAYSGGPVVVEDGMKNWSALDTFSFEFFQGVYGEGSSALKNVHSRCQFFPYKTKFRGLGEVLAMPAERAHMKDGSKPWYVGWSNCDASAGNVLRQHYRRPYFLPANAESSKTDWIFMGSPGYGAHMHIDNVHLPSWQAQVTGTKRWRLEPPSECFTHCATSLTADIKPGQIIILDTNKWFHSTLVIGHDISITIGSEYD